MAIKLKSAQASVQQATSKPAAIKVPQAVKREAKGSAWTTEVLATEGSAAIAMVTPPGKAEGILQLGTVKDGAFSWWRGTVRDAKLAHAFAKLLSSIEG